MNDSIFHGRKKWHKNVSVFNLEISETKSFIVTTHELRLPTLTNTTQLSQTVKTINYQ